MLCNQILDRDGKVSSLYIQLVKKNQGNEDAALEEWIRLAYETDTRFQLSGNPLNEMFLKHDRFTEEEEQNLRAHGHEGFIQKDKVDGKTIWSYTDGFGRKKQVEENNYQDAVNDLIESRKSFYEGFTTRVKELLSFFKDGVSPDDLQEKIRELFGEMPMHSFYQFVDGLQINNITSLSDLQDKPFYDPALAEEKIFIHEEKIDNKSVYTLLLPTPSRPTSAYPGHGKFSFMKRFVGNEMEARRKGFTIEGDIEGRKEISAAMMAIRIKMHDSNASFSSARFASMNMGGMSMDMDLHRGINNIIALAKSDKFSDLLPSDIKDFVLSDKMNPADYQLDYVTQLLGRVRMLSDKSKIHAEMLRYLQTGDRHDKIKIIQKRMAWMERTFTKAQDSQKPAYLDGSTEAGKEYYVLSESLQQLKLQHGGIDRRSLNTDIVLGDSHVLKSTLDIANQTVTMVMQDLHKYFDVAKSYWKQKYYPKKKKIFEKLINKKSINAKNFLINDSESIYQNLFQKQNLKVVKDGKFTGQMVEANLLRMKNPDDMGNNLQESEREFIRDVVGLMKESIVRFIDKRISDGTLGKYKDGEEWYNEHYKTQELLMPVLRKDFLSKLFSGGVKGAKEGIDDLLEETMDNMVVATGRSLDWGNGDSYGVASSQRGGMHGSWDRMNRLGLDDHNGELVVIDVKKNRSASFDVEKIVDYSVFSNEKQRFEVELQTTYNAAKVILQHQEQRKGQEMKYEHEFMDRMFNNLVHAYRKELVIGGKINAGKGIDIMRKTTSAMTLTGNAGSIFLNFSGVSAALSSTALSRRFGKHFFDITAFGKALKKMYSPEGYKKMSDLVDIFLMHESDEVDILFNDKYKSGNKGIFTSRNAMLPMTTIDRMTKGLVLTSQLIYEGLYKNFKYDKEGVLYYDWSLDKRYNEEARNEIIRNQEAIGRDPLPYDDLMIRSLTFISNKITGSYTDNEKAFYQTSDIGQALTQFKGYMVGRVKDLYTTGFDNTNLQWYEMDKEGKLKTWVYYQEGILQSFVALSQELYKYRTIENMKPEQMGNLRKMGYDMAIWGLLGVSYLLLRGVDEEDKDKRSLSMYAMYAWMDVIGVYNLNDYSQLVGTPVFISKLTDAAAATYSLATWDVPAATRQYINLYGPLKTGKQAADLLGQ